MKYAHQIFKVPKYTVTSPYSATREYGLIVTKRFPV
jgi:hypothetical protein